jgi:hypothetical protein
MTPSVVSGARPLVSHIRCDGAYLCNFAAWLLIDVPRPVIIAGHAA